MNPKTPAKSRLVKKTGQKEVLIIKIGSSWIVGFDEDRIEKGLARRTS